MNNPKNSLRNGVMFNAYPDSIGTKLSDLVTFFQKKELENTFSFCYLLPTFFNSDLDRGFSIIDYNLNEELVTAEDVTALKNLNIQLKFDIVLNHLSVASPQFKDLLEHGEKSIYKDFFINWNDFWENHGIINEEGIVIPNYEFLQKLFMRKSGLPILKVPFPDGTEKPYWNTFYQEITYKKFTKDDFSKIDGIPENQTAFICQKINDAIDQKMEIENIDFEENNYLKENILQIIQKNKCFLGQMDVNAKSELVWGFYEETLKKLKKFGCKILRLDAFAYLHKEVGETNFFNKPGTWNYLDRIQQIATKNDLIVLPEIHAEYGLHLHEEVAQKGYHFYDFFLPGLLIHTLETKNNSALIHWIDEIITKKYNTINMLGCHDGIPILDLKGKENQKGLLNDTEIDDLMEIILKRGGRIKNLYDAAGKKLSYYQINATFFSALGEDEQKLLLARAIQLFMPGIPQVWYLDVFAGKNNYEAADNAGSGGHKEINRTAISMEEIEKSINKNVVSNQLKIIQLRNNLSAFLGNIEFQNSSKEQLQITWRNETSFATLDANLKTSSFSISYEENKTKNTLFF
ncbi:glycosidase [Polaribacter sp. BAL334]|uniref:alpha-amylase family glycosyl hydrolase n=1 Tax=Polaribacter sp. BAL334 TaxID=1708178 RepID=UPI0018D22C60|nr:alpha-amylase family glycosyl hydrolase [Polaribacter sp. BAL334]MBG7613492.1 glycosidase [Polaribacter sp. BAL334]